MPRNSHHDRAGARMRGPLSTARARIAVSLLALIALVAVAGLAVFSAFSSTQATGTSTFSAGTVALSTDGTGSALFEMPDMQPGASASRCVEVKYDGSLPASVQMYGTQSGDLAEFLRTSIVRGSFSGEPPADHSCEGFRADPEPEGALWSGALSELPSAASPLLEGATWSEGSVHVYKITVTLPADAPSGAEGTSAEASFTWQAQNS